MLTNLVSRCVMPRHLDYLGGHNVQSAGHPELGVPTEGGNEGFITCGISTACVERLGAEPAPKDPLTSWVNTRVDGNTAAEFVCLCAYVSEGVAIGLTQVGPNVSKTDVVVKRVAERGSSNNAPS